MHFILNSNNLLRNESDLSKKNKKLLIEPKVFSLNVILEIPSFSKNDSARPNYKNNSKSLIRVEELKKFKREEKCLQDSWQLSNIKLWEKKQWESSETKSIGLNNNLSQLLMNIFKISSKDSMKDKCKLNKKPNIWKMFEDRLKRIEDENCRKSYSRIRKWSETFTR